MSRFAFFFVILTVIKSYQGQEVTKICSICDCANLVIDCTNAKLEASLQAEAWKEIIDQNVTYEEAKFDNNHIGHVTRFPSIPLLKLSLRKNVIVKIDDKAFKNLTNLIYLDLSYNELTTENLGPNVFEGNYSPDGFEPLYIEVLDLSYNELHSLHQDLFEHLPKIKRLFLQWNPLKIIDYGPKISITSLSYLELLDLSHTGIKELPEGFLHTLKNLLELNLKQNQFTEIPDTVLAEAHNLQVLNLNDNPIKLLSSSKPFPLMPTLKQLHISFMSNLTRIEDRALSNLIHLEFLDCKSNALLEYISPVALSRLENKTEVWPNIISLDLSDDELTHLDFDLLGPRWIQLKHLKLLGNKWSCDCDNQWMLDRLVPILKDIKSPVNGLRCAGPEQMKSQQLITLYNRKYEMRCLDYYQNHPERDGTILISVFVVVILMMVLTGVFFWRRNTNCSFRQGGRINYSKAFYRPASSEEPERF